MADWKKIELQMMDMLNQRESADGQAWIEKGQIHVKNPLGEGRYAVIIKGPLTRLWVDGEEVIDQQIVTESSQIRYELEVFPPQSKMNITLSPDQVKAYLNLTFEKGVEYRLVDKPPQQLLRLEAEVARELPPPAITLDDVKQRAESLGIKVPLALEAVEYALLIQEGGSFLLAKGKAPVHGKNESLVMTNFHKSPLELASENTQSVDYRDRGQIPSVEMGSVVAIKLAGSKGEPGYNVKGEILPAQDGLPLQVVAGNGIRPMENDTKFVATAMGRPTWSPRTQVLEILPCYEVYSDVDMNAGNIVFSGDVIVHGNVLEGFLVRSSGMVTVEGSVFGGRIEADSHITVRQHLVSGVVEGGGEGAFLKQTLAFLIPLKNLMGDCLQAIGELKRNPAFSFQDLNVTGDGPLIKLLFDLKFPNIPRNVKKLKELTQQKNQLDPALASLMRKLENNLIGLGPLQFSQASEFTELREEVSQLVDHIQQEVTHKANVIVSSVQNSQITTTGSITVTGKGVVQSQLTAGETIIIQGALRGGAATSDRRIVVGELGSEAEALTQVQVGAGGIIQAKKVHPNVILGIDRYHTKNMHSGVAMKCVYDNAKGIIVDFK